MVCGPLADLVHGLMALFPVLWSPVATMMAKVPSLLTVNGKFSSSERTHPSGDKLSRNAQVASPHGVSPRYIGG